MNESDLRHALLDLAPSAPASPDRAGAARARARRSRSRRVMLAAAAALVGAIAAPVSFLGDREPSPAQPAPAPQVPCPADEPDPGFPRSSFVGTGTVPTGAVAVRLCFPGGPNPWEPPQDLLVHGADALARQINAVEVNPNVRNDKRSCTARLGTDWGYQFGYPGGWTHYISASTGGCSGIQVGVLVRGQARDAINLYRAFRDALLEQRRTVDPRAPLSGGALPDRVFCPGQSGSRPSWITLVGEPARVPQLRQAAVCRFGGTDRHHVSQLSAAEVELLNADLRAETGPLPPAGPLTVCEGSLLPYAIAGRDAWGDNVVLRHACGRWEVGRALYWSPSPDVGAMLREHAGLPGFD